MLPNQTTVYSVQDDGDILCTTTITTIIPAAQFQDAVAKQDAEQSAKADDLASKKAILAQSSTVITNLQSRQANPVTP